MTTTQNNTKTTARRATAADKSAAAKVNQASLDTLVKAYKTAAGNTSGVEGQMLSLDEQRRVLRVWQARAAVAVFNHPEVGKKYLTAATAVSEARNTFRRFVDAGLKLKNPQSTDAPTAAEIKAVNSLWEKVAVDQKDRDSKPKEKVSKVGQSTEKQDGEKQETESTEPPTFKDVLRATKMLATVIQQVQNEKGQLTKAEVTALKSSLQVIINDAAKGAVQNAAK